MPSYQFDQYQIRIYTSRSSTDLNAARSDVVIFVYNGNTYRGVIRFYPDGTDLQAGSHDESRGRVNIHLNTSQFPDVVETLRRESPLYLYGSTGYQFIHTGAEPVGEEEGG